MSEKQETIINGIDVSECKFYEPKAQKMTCHEEAITKPCESTPICYYKLLQKSYIEIQRLQEENEELGKIINCKTGTIQFLAKVRDDLKQENEELKAKNKNYAKLMLVQQEISRKYWECIGKIKQAIEVLAETCNVYPLKTNLDKLITTINEVLNDRD